MQHMDRKACHAEIRAYVLHDLGAQSLKFHRTLHGDASLGSARHVQGLFD